MKKIHKIEAKPKSNVERIDKHKAAVFKLDLSRVPYLREGARLKVGKRKN